MADGPKIKNCPLEFAFECPKKWTSLKRTSDKAVRLCEVCKLEVHFCETLQKATEKAGQGLCIALGPNIESKSASSSGSRKGKLRVGVVRLAPEPEIEPAVEKGEWSRKRDGKRGRNKSRH